MSFTQIYNSIRQVAHASIVGILVAAAFLFAGCINDEKHTHENTTLVNVGDKAPDFEVELVDGGSTTLSAFSGQVVMLIFFSTECPDCQNQFAEIQRMMDEREPSFKILAISRAESVEATESFCQRYGITDNVGVDPTRSIYELYANYYVPRNFLIGRDGYIKALTVEYAPDELHAIWAKAEGL